MAKRTIVFLGAHPADPFDMAAGTMALHAAEGDRVIALSLTHGARSHAPRLNPGDPTLSAKEQEAHLERTIAAKLEEFQRACEIVGAEGECLKHMDEPFVPGREVIVQVAELYREYRPDILVTQHKAEMGNHDHPPAGDVSLRAATSAGRGLENSKRAPHNIPQIYFYGWQFRRLPMVYHGALPLPATHIVNIEPVIEKKIAALKAFASQAYFGQNYDSDAFIRQRVAALEGSIGLENGIKYAEHFIALRPAISDRLA